MAIAVPPPPSPDVTELPYGTRLVAGLGEATVLADLDFETYSEAGLQWDEAEQKWIAPFNARKKGLQLVGAQVYMEHPTAEVLSLAYDLKNGRGKRLWLPNMPPPLDLFEHLANGLLLEAFNSAFEEKVWNIICVKKYGWPRLNSQQLRCAQAKARAFCLPGKLIKTGEALGVKETKDTAGTRLLSKFSMPRNPTKKNPSKRILPLEDLKDGIDLYKYNLQDIVAEAHVSAKTPDLNAFELRYWLMDQECNMAGVKLDKEAIISAIEMLEEAYAQGRERLKIITNGEVDDVTKVQKIVKWLSSRDVHTGSIDADHTDELLSREDLPNDCREVLQLRKDLGSAAVKKMYTMRVQMTEAGRAHDMFIYHGARTGRDAGVGIQPQNMSNSGPEVYKCLGCYQYFDANKDACPFCIRSAPLNILEWNAEAADQAIYLIKTKQVHMVYEDLAEVLSGCVRGLMIADDGCDFICTDYSAIEAVVAAALAKEQWRLDIFHKKECIYLASASKITGVPVEHYLEYKKKNGHHHPHRKLGKIAELASGFGGWLGSWLSFGAGDHLSNEEEIKQSILAWRAASPNIVDAWGGQQVGPPWDRTAHLHGLEGAFIKAVMSPGEQIHWKSGVSYLYKGGNVYCLLPSGRAITYHNVSLAPDPRKQGCLKILFWGWNTNPKMGQMGWVQLDTYGGRLFENVVQATARDIMAYAAVNLNDVGYKIRLRVHDELAAMVPEGWGSVEEMERIAGMMPSWAEGWPVRASGGWRGKRFRK